MRRLLYLVVVAAWAAPLLVSAGGRYWYVSSSTYDGSTADTAAAAGEHMCTPGEWVLSSRDFSKGTLSVAETYLWVDTDTNTTSATAGDCADWSTNAGANNGHISFISNVSALEPIGQAWRFSSINCATPRHVLICSDP